MRDLSWPPFAPVLMESMRAIGYSLETAIADLVDNCVSAQAKTISIRLPPGEPSFLGVLDDGNGMSFDELKNAMRHGSRSPTDSRPEGDLGRFGLGLKTASLSQCRRLIVLSKKHGQISGVAWDIDHVIAKGEWSLQVLDDADLRVLPLVADLKRRVSGTLVLWQKLDRAASGDPGTGTVLSERIDRASRHLSLVFHKFLSGEADRRIELDINANPVLPIDPFLSAHSSTIRHPVEVVPVLGTIVRIEGFTLPHISQLTKEQIAKAGGREELRREQGFYVYRNNRLIVWGTWFRLFPQQELSKLTRVMVDVTNELDHEWTLDIKKSMASPPEALRKRLRELIPKMCEPSEKAHQFRGKRTNTSKTIPVWERLEGRQGVSYCISRSHPVVQAALESTDDRSPRDVHMLLRLIEETFPSEALYNDRALERMGHKQVNESDKELSEYLEQLAMSILAAASGSPEGRRNLLNGLDMIEPFSQHPELTKKLKERLSA